jgi:DNA-binding CsgD family transcriptional regulator
MKIEIYSSADGLDLIATNGNEIRKIHDNDTIVNVIEDSIKAKYPKANKRLNEKYPASSFERVRRFCKCNFSNNDRIPDIDGSQFNFEFVSCPMRGECNDENIICNPELETGLTIRETEIVKEFAAGKMAKEVAVSLRISTTTAETHKRHIYAKLGIGTVGELTNWAHGQKLIF